MYSFIPSQARTALSPILFQRDESIGGRKYIKLFRDGAVSLNFLNYMGRSKVHGLGSPHILGRCPLSKARGVAAIALARVNAVPRCFELTFQVIQRI